MSKKLVNTIIIVLAFFIGLILGLIIKPNTLSNPLTTTGQNTYQAGWNAAEQRLAQSGMIPALNKNIQIKNVSGTVEKINGDKLTVKIVPLNPLADPSSNERTVDINNNTKFYQMVQKNPQEYQNEVAAFQKTEGVAVKNANSQTTTPPLPFDKKAIGLSDIKVGMQVLIMADGDIKTAQEFTATEIDLTSANQAVSATAAPNQPVQSSAQTSVAKTTSVVSAPATTTTTAKISTPTSTK